ncbi:aldehyde dehydrogenase domain-containing protein [Gymnopilus junonius]|uniref:Aldehyde dehydrogenase domain-containing protein n=1 Tax=Gymnopilus junonius TaxID=109634 RepID=A0A9P5P1L5_GYMJU|nr:aldehyde dehydrogenase domain-containing protein [Gymnopilus junonius]
MPYFPRERLVALHPGTLTRVTPLVTHRFIHVKPYAPSHPPSDIPVFNPATGEGLFTVQSSSVEHVHSTIWEAQCAFDSGVWSRSSSLSRSKVLSKLARVLEEKIPSLAELETLQTGRAIREMRTQLGRLPEWLDYYAALLRTHQSFVAPTQGKLLNYVERVPLGVVAQITPFNHPLLIAIKKIAPALAAGNSVVVKPSEFAPVTVYEFIQMAEKAGVPPKVLSFLPGGPDTANSIVKHPSIRKVDITAGTSTGHQIGSIVGANLATYTAELGGKAPIVLFEDADLVSAVNGAAFASFVASGQTCVSGTRLIVHDKIYGNFMSLFMQKVDSIRRRMGDPSNPKCMMGSVISPKHLQRMDEMVKRASVKASILTGGEPMTGISDLDGFDFSQGSFYPPTVISDVSVEDEIWQEEVFGPVVVVKPFKTEAEAIHLANASKYGLGAGIWTTDLSRAHRVSAAIQSGLCWVNTHHRNDPSSPWGGMKSSGIGRENGIEAFEAYSQSKSTIVNTASVEDSRKNDDWFADDNSREPRRYG